MSDLPVTRSYNFKAGVSGNLAGRPKQNIELRDMAKEYLQDALNVLVQIFENKRSPSSARVNASNVLLDYGHGKPIMHINSVKTGGTMQELLAKPELQNATPEELEIARIALKDPTDIEEFLSTLSLDDVTEQEAREAGLDWDYVNNRLADTKDIVVIDDAEEDYTADL